MPIPISHLFSDEDDINIHCHPSQKDIYDMSKGWPDINISIQDIPNAPYPEPGSYSHRNDLECIINYTTNPVNHNKFLKFADEKPFDLFKRYVNENNLDIDMDYLDLINNQFANFILTLKFKHNRPRPKKYMESVNHEYNWEKIKNNKSPSYPSGHSAHAFFNACIVANKFPDHAENVKNLAELIAQSRLDLGVHYPSDISFGKFVGEYAAKTFINQDDNKNKGKQKNMLKEDSNNLSGRKKIINFRNRHNDKSIGTKYVDELCEFIIRSNAIENYIVNVDEAYSASENFIKGLPVKYCTDNKYIFSHLNALDTALSLDSIDSPKKVQQIHESLGDNVLERGYAGVFRDFEHCTRLSGYQFSNPTDILSDLNSLCSNQTYSPFERHIVYECIHPFSDGNGRSGRIILASDLDFDLAELNDLIGNDYIPSIVSYQNKHM